jgi:hypothetical protein
MRAGHVRRDPGFIDEDEALGIKVELALEPVLSPLQDIGPILLTCVRVLFCPSQLVTLSEAPKRGDAQQRARLRQERLQLRQGDVGCLYKKRPDKIAMLLGVPRQPIAVLRLGAPIASRPPQRLPADGARRTDAKRRRSVSARRPFFNNGQDTGAKGKRKRLGHEGRPPSPGLILNQIKANSGISKSIQLGRILSRSLLYQKASETDHRPSR